MTEYINPLLPTKPEVISESENIGVYEISHLFPGYGATLGNSIRRMLLSSISGAAITKIKIKGVQHEFSTISGVKEDVISIILNLKRLRVSLKTEESPQKMILTKKGVGVVTAADFKCPTQVNIENKDFKIAEITDAKTELEIECEIGVGIGFVPKSENNTERTEIGVIIPDVFFSPIKRAFYEISNMRVGDRTDFDKLRITIETNGTITPREAFERSINKMILQLQAILGFQKDRNVEVIGEDELKSTKISELNLPPATIIALEGNGIKTISGLSRKKESQLAELPGIGKKSLEDIKKCLAGYGIVLDK